MLLEKPKHYCNNKQLLEWIIEYKKTNDKDLYTNICLAIDAICKRNSHNRNFINYTYRDEMIADGIYACIKAIKNFDPEKSENPFSYFTQISNNAFKARITKEKQQDYIQKKMITNYFDVIDLENEEKTIKETQLQILESYDIGKEDGFDYFRKKEQEIEDNKKEKQNKQDFEIRGLDLIFGEFDEK